MSGPVEVLAVVRDAVKVFETQSFRLLIDHSEFAVEAGTLHQHLMASYVAVAVLIAECGLLLKGVDSVGELTVVQPHDLANFRAALANVGAAA